MLGRVVILTELVRQARVRVHADPSLGYFRQLFYIRAQIIGAERAVEPDRERPDMADRVVECLERLARQRAPGRIGDRPGDHDGDCRAARLEQRLERVDSGLGVERVEDRLDE